MYPFKPFSMTEISSSPSRESLESSQLKRPTFSIVPHNHLSFVLANVLTTGSPEKLQSPFVECANFYGVNFPTKTAFKLPTCCREYGAGKGCATTQIQQVSVAPRTQVIIKHSETIRKR